MALAASQAGAVLAAPDKFKGTLSGEEVAAALVRGAQRAGRVAHPLPIADGGEGTAAALLAARGGRWVPAAAHDALGRCCDARFALLGDGETAVVEVAEASGQWRLAPEELDPLGASTHGTGELIAAAAAAGARTVIVAAGGSATTDGGSGASAVLDELPHVPRLLVACDTQVVFERAPAVYAPQKGADAATVAELATRLARLAERLPRDPRGRPMSGAAGGLAGGLWATHDAQLVAGGELVLDAVGADARIAGARLVLTGEGRLDTQTLTGKAVAAIAGRCARAGVACAAVVGRDELGASGHAQLDLAAVVEAGDAAAISAAAERLVGKLIA